MTDKLIIASLDEIAHAVKNPPDVLKIENAIQKTRALISRDGTAELKKLDNELSTWLTKLPVIVKEPAGREGMAKHAKYWAERLRSLRGGTK